MRRSKTLFLATQVSVAALIAGAATGASAQTASPGNYPSNVPAPSNQAAGACEGPGGASNPACAQAGSPADGSTADVTDPTRDVVVTGSRLRRPDYATASPIVSLDANTLQQSGTTNVTDFLTGYPALIGSSTSAQNSGDRAGIGGTGLNLLNLRNLGTQRTLVLVDGRRHVAGLEGDASVDINTIPSDLIERIDVETGGVSAIYGADAVTGVVNFVLKHDFEGITGHAQAGISERGDAGQRQLSLTAGKNFAGGKGNIAVAYEYGQNDRYRTQDRDYLSGPNSITFNRNPDYTANTAGSYARVPLTGVGYADSARNGAVDVDGDGIPDFTGTGAVYDRGRLIGGGYTIGGSSTRVADYGNDLLPQIERHVVNTLGHYDISPALTLFAEGKFAISRSYSLAQPTFDTYLFVPQDNPYIPSNIRAAIDPALGGVLVTRDNFDLGQRGEFITRKTWRSVVGARGDLNDATHYEVSYVFGRTNVTNHFVNDRYTDRFYAAIDAVRDASGNIVCRGSIAGGATTDQPYQNALNGSTFSPNQCQPLNLFGEGVASQAAINFIRADTTEHSRITQHVVNGSVSGDFRHVLSLPGGEIGYVLGGEYRKEESSFDPDPLELQGLTFSNKLSPTRGSYDVKEGFAELDLPLLKDRPFFQIVDLSAAYRYSSYSTIGSTSTYKFDATWAPVRDIRFRGTYSYAVRAPNISELFAGASQTFVFFDDPCTSQNRAGSATRTANCAAVLSAAGLNAAQIAAFDDPRSTNISGTQSGNFALKPERARTWTAGVVLQPRFIPGLTASFDWYDIKLKDAINTVDAQQLAQLCVDQPTTNNVFCQSIQRQQGTGLINGFTVQPQNVAQFRTNGLDANITYHTGFFDLGSLNVKLVGGYLHELNFVGTPGAVATNDLQTQYAPKFQANSDITFSTGPVTFNYGLSWFDKTRRYTIATVGTNANYVSPNYFYIKDRWVHDLYVSVDVTKRFQFYGGVNNVADTKPDLGLALYPVDAVGRFFFAGARVKLPRF